MKPKILLITVLLIAGLSACSENNSKNSYGDNNAGGQSPMMTTYSYQVELVNLSAGQPLSPPAFVIHNEGFTAFEIGAAATTGLEMLAESGDSMQFLSESRDSEAVYSTETGAGIIHTGSSQETTLEITRAQTVTSDILLSVTSMLVNTNDALVAGLGMDLSNMEVGEQMSYLLNTFDSGTEANSETADTIPGPAAAGGAQEGYNPLRDDTADQITAHPGVISMEDGLSTSTLTSEHRWDNPAVKVIVTRTN